MQGSEEVKGEFTNGKWLDIWLLLISVHFLDVIILLWLCFLEVLIKMISSD